MCNKYINYQTKEVLDMKKVNELADNAMLKHRIELFEEWNFEENNILGLSIYKVTQGSHTKAWWICSKCESIFNTSIASRVRYRGCPYCTGKRVNHTNSLASLNPELAKQWHPTKNGDLTPNDVTISSGKRVWWICSICNNNYETKISTRNIGCNCPYCAGNSINYTNSLMALNPELASEWHPTKNGKLTPDMVSPSSHSKVWWLGRCGHEWEAEIANRSGNNASCPVCTNRTVSVGFNDMWTTNPTLASQLLNPEDGYRYVEGSRNKTDWKCLNCNKVIESRVIDTIRRQGLSCPLCSDGVSYPEKFIHNLLQEIDTHYLHQKTFIWSNNKVYDFYFPYEKEGVIIETHGGQHYKESNRKGARTLIEEQVNDRYKHVMAMHNKISRYIILDCRNSDLEWIKNSVLNSELANMFDLSHVDWNRIDINSKKSYHIEILKLWNTGLSTKEISNKIKMSRVTISYVLNKFSRVGLCQYNN